MTQASFRQLDLNLLRVLAILHRTRSVTATAATLSLSQPATSNALARLRSSLGDELFVRSPRGLQPTRRCDALAPAVIDHLNALEALFSGRDGFDPRTSERHWKLNLSDLGELLFLPALASRLHRESPRAKLSNVSIPVSEVPSALESREIDAAVGPLEAKHRGIRADVLFHEQFMAISSPAWRPKGRKALVHGKLSFSDLGPQLAVVSPHPGSPIEQLLANQKLDERIVLRARHYGALAELAQSTQLIAIVPAMYAREMRRTFDLQVWALHDAPYYEFRLLWHASTDADQALEWFRSVLRTSLVPPASLTGAVF